jgi:hypothetical protein
MLLRVPFEAVGETCKPSRRDELPDMYTDTRSIGGNI